MPPRPVTRPRRTEPDPTPPAGCETLGGMSDLVQQVEELAAAATEAHLDGPGGHVAHLVDRARDVVARGVRERDRDREESAAQTAIPGAAERALSADELRDIARRPGGIPFARGGDGKAVLGPMLLGTEKPAQIARLGASVSEIVTLAALAAYDFSPVGGDEDEE